MAILKVALHTGALAADYSASTNMSEEYADEFLSKLADMLNSTGSEASAAADSTTVKSIVSKKNADTIAKFDNDEQQDCHEFAQIGLDMLAEEHQSDAPNTGGNGPSINRSSLPVEKFFRITVSSYLRCTDQNCCFSASRRFSKATAENSTSLGLGDATAGSRALAAQDLLRSHFGTEELLPDFICTSCDCKDVSKKVDKVTAG